MTLFDIFIGKICVRVDLISITRWEWMTVLIWRTQIQVPADPTTAAWILVLSSDYYNSLTILYIMIDYVSNMAIITNYYAVSVLSPFHSHSQPSTLATHNHA